ncbi:MAG: YaaA family protein [Bacteroides sp.]|nr:YaaA family protein [Bacteroides sp.]
MLTLIAESKTMTACNQAVSPKLYNRHRPADEEKAAAIMDRIAGITPRELTDLTHLSFAMATKLHMLAVDFPYKGVGQAAIQAFTGVVFKALDVASLSSQAGDYLNQHLRIISSLYGWLRPDDIIKAYRMDYTSPLSPDGNSLYSFWRETVTLNLIREIQESKTGSVLNLLPADAAKCVDWKEVKPHAEVLTVDIKELKEGGKFTTPHAGRLKTLRGHLLREICEQNISDASQLKTLSTSLLLPMGTPDRPDHIAFCVR